MRHACPEVQTHDSQALQPWVLAELLRICDHSPTVDGHAIGWMPRQAFREMHTRQRLVCCTNNADVVGYVAWSVSQGVMRILLTWVRADARLIMHGRALVDHIECHARTHRCPRVELFCAVDLAANMFWSAVGFQQICWRWGRAKKGRRHWLWRRHVVTNPELPLLSSAVQQAQLVETSLPHFREFAAEADGTKSPRH